MSSRTHTMHTNFTAGELSPKLEGRIDVTKYFNSAKTIENFLIMPYGGVAMRPGTYYAAEVKTSAKATRVIPFQFSTTQAYIIEIGDQYMRFYKDSGQITLSGTAYEIATPYLEADIFELQFAQSADVLYIAHKDYAPRKLARTGHTSWTLSIIDFVGGPFQDDNITAITMNPSSTTGNITITASSAFFTSSMVGGLIKIAGTTGTPAVQGYAKITYFTDSTHVNATVQQTLSASGATDDWAIGAWMDEYGYPGSVTFFEQRLVWGGSTEQPQTVWGSVTSSFEDHTAGTDDDDALLYTIYSEQVNAIEWFSSGKTLHIGTSGGTFTMDSGSSSTPLSPTNVVVRRETTFGGKHLLPKKIGNVVYYVQRNGRKVREISYQFQNDSYTAGDVTILADHITESGIVDIDYQQSPHSFLWCVRDDGEIAVLTREHEQEVAGWSRIVTNGYFESVAIIPNGEEDQVWVVVRRVIGSTTKRFIEYFKPLEFGDDQEDCYYVDCGLTYDSTPATTMSGLTHLEGESVTILADGAVHPNKTVASGEVELNSASSVVHIGLGYEATLKTTRPEIGDIKSSSQGKIKRITKAIVRLYRSLGVVIGTDDSQDVVPFRNTSDDMDTAIPLYSGDKELHFPGGYTKDGNVVIKQTQPLPLNILAVIMQMTVYDG